MGRARRLAIYQTERSAVMAGQEWPGKDWPDK
jgi:hypothetical protein